MKRLIVLLIIIGIVGTAFYYIISISKHAVRRLSSPLPTVAPVPTEKIINPTPAPYSVKIGDKDYEFYFHKIAANETLDLIPNFDEATSSAFIFQKNNCSFGINAGFYMTDRKPLGLFATHGVKKGEYIASTTFNGFIYQSATDSAKINFAHTSSIVGNDWRPYNFIFQTGPLYFLKSPNRPIFTDQNPARRHLITKDAAGNFYLFSIFEKDNIFNGPRLQDIYSFFENAEVKQIADFEEVLNLDGGSASAFYDAQVQIVEFKPIGSFLCGRSQL